MGSICEFVILTKPNIFIRYLLFRGRPLPKSVQLVVIGWQSSLEEQPSEACLCLSPVASTIGCGSWTGSLKNETLVKGPMLTSYELESTSGKITQVSDTVV